MNRRTLVRVAVGLGLGTLAGCLGAADEPPEDDEGTDTARGNETKTTANGSEADERTDRTDDTDSTDVLDDETDLEFETLEAGPIGRVRTVPLDGADEPSEDGSEDENRDENDGDGSEDEDDGDDEEPTAYHRIVVENEEADEREVELRIERDDTVVLEGTNPLPGETALEVVLSEPGSYETTLESGWLTNTTSISRSGPCEESRTVVSFTAGGGISTNTTTSC